MNIDINNIDPKLLEEDDRIVAYLKGQMSAEEEHKFLKELEDNTEQKERAITIARLVKGLKEVGAEQDGDAQRVILASNKQDIEAATKRAIKYSASASKTPLISLSHAAKWLSIAASLICIVWLGFTYNSYKNTTALGEQYDCDFTPGMVVRGQETQTEADKKLVMLFDKVKENKNLDDVIHELSLYWELSTMETYNDYTNYSAEIGWKLSIAYLKNNDKNEAKNVLKKIVEYFDDDSDIRQKAMDLLNHL